jgi:hypothetical protein
LLDLPIRGRDYYYYIVSVGAQNTDNTGLTPTGDRLISNRYYSQSYDPVRLLGPPGELLSEIRVVPNPYSRRATSDLSLDLDRNIEFGRIDFVGLPRIATIEIYTEIGERIKTIQHDNGSGATSWNLQTDSRQEVVSGIYIARFINKDPLDDEFGQETIRKIVIIL